MRGWIRLWCLPVAGAAVGALLSVGRILGARFAIDGVEYRLQAGGGGHCSHGGSPGFADRVWRPIENFFRFRSRRSNESNYL